MKISYGDEGSLSFEAEIETSKFDAGVKKIESGIDGLARKQEQASNSISDNIGKSISKMSAENQAILDRYAKQAKEAEELFKQKQQVIPSSTLNNIKDVAQDVLSLKKATQENNDEQDIASEVLGSVSLDTFTLAGAISFATGFLIAHKKEILDWVVALFKGEEASAAATKALKEQLSVELALRDATLKGAQSATQETTQMQTLYKAATNLNIPLKERNKIIDEMQSKYPDYFGNFTNEEILAGKAEKAYNLLTTAIIAAAKARAAQDAIAENQSRVLENDFNKADLATEREKARAEVLKQQKNFNATNKYKDNTASSMTGATVISQSDLAAGALSQAKRDLEAIDKKIFDISTDSDILNKKNAKLANDVQMNIQKNGAVALLGINDSKPKEDKKDKTLDERRSLVAKLESIDDEYKRKSFTKDQEEIKALEDKFSKIRKLINFFNKDNPTKAISLVDFDQTEMKAKGDLKFRQDTEKLKLSLVEQKALYKEFESSKTIIGEQKAKERFSGLLNTEKSYMSILQDELAKLDKKTDLSGPELERKKDLEDNLKTESKARMDIKEKEFAEAFNAALSFNQTIERINKEFSDKAIALGKSITDEQKNELLRQKANAIDIANDEAFAKTEIYKRLAQETIVLSRDQIKDQVSVLKDLLKDHNLDPKINSQLNERLSSLKKGLSLGTRNSQTLGLKKERADIEKALEFPQSEIELKKLQDRLIKVGLELKKLTGNATGADKGVSGFVAKLSDNEALKDISKYTGIAANGFNTMSEALGGNATAAGYTLDTLGQLAGGVSDLAAGLASGDPAKMIGSAIKAVGTLFSIGKKVKEMNAAARKEVSDFYANATSGEREYQDLLMGRRLATIKDNKVALQGIRDEIALRKSQTNEYSKEAAEIMAKLQGQQFIASETYKHGTWFKKATTNKTYASLAGMDFEQLSSLLAQGKLEGDAKALVERLKELEQKGYDAQQAMADLAKETAELFTGTTSDNLTTPLTKRFLTGTLNLKLNN